MEQSALRTWVWHSCDLNHEYWCKCTWWTNGINKTSTSDRLDLRWQLGFQWHWRGIELVFKSLDCFTKRLFHSATIFCCYICVCCLKLNQADYKVEEGFFCCCFFTSIWWGSTQLQCIYYLHHLPIFRPPRVFRHYKRRLCSFCVKIHYCHKKLLVTCIIRLYRFVHSVDWLICYFECN